MNTRIWWTCIAVYSCALLLAAGCETKHTPSANQIVITAAAPAGMHAGSDAGWTVSWSGGVAPYNVSFDMGGGAEPDTLAVTGAVSPLTQLFTMLNPSATEPTEFTATITVTDSNALTATRSIDYSVGLPAEISITIPTFIMAADTLYAVPCDDSVAVGERVKIALVTGATANPFLYLNSAAVTVEGAVDAQQHFVKSAGAYYNPGSFDIGAPDLLPDTGGADPVDGIWTALGATSFIIPPDDLINTGTDIGGGRVRIQLNVTPLDGAAAAGAEGALCNFELKFDLAGTYHLGLQQFEGVDRTYYSDDATPTNYYDWGALMADAAGALGAGVEAGLNEIVVQ